MLQWKSVQVVLVLGISILTGCATVDPSGSDPDFCKVSSLKDFEGQYVNQPSGNPTRIVHLSETFPIGATAYDQLNHMKIQVVRITAPREDLLQIEYVAEGVEIFSKSIPLDVDSKTGAVLIYSQNDFLPDPSGGLMVGPQSVRLVMYKSCNDGIGVMQSMSSYGLLLALIPFGGSSQTHWKFNTTEMNK